MVIKARIIPDKTIIIIDDDQVKVRELVKKAGFDFDEVIVIVNGRIIDNEDFSVSGKDEVMIVRVGTGG